MPCILGRIEASMISQFLDDAGNVDAGLASFSARVSISGGRVMERVFVVLRSAMYGKTKHHQAIPAKRRPRKTVSSAAVLGMDNSAWM
jgi:hypothetical protein